MKFKKVSGASIQQGFISRRSLGQYPKDSSEIKIVYTPIEYVQAGEVLLSQIKQQQDAEKPVEAIDPNS